MNLRFPLSILALVAINCCASSATWAAEGGSLKGRFVFAGKAPEPKPVTLTGGDAAFCGMPEHKKKLFDETLVVGKDGGLENVFFYMEKKPAGALHPFYDAKKKDKVIIDNLGCRFEPHAVGLWTEQALTLGNKDKMGHNTNIAGIDGKSINIAIPGGGSIDETFKVSERLPLNVACNIHPWMKAKLLIKDHPYFAISDAAGNFEIKHIPAGEYDFRVNHENWGYISKVNIGGKAVEWKTGKVTKIKIEEGKTYDLGVVQVAPK